MKSPRRVSFVSTAAIGLILISQAAWAVDAVAKSDVNVRTGPGVSFSRVDTLFGGEAVNITECQGSWCYIEHDGPDGWVSANYLMATGSSGSGSGSGSSSGGSSGSGSSAGSGGSGGDAAAAAILGLIVGGILGSASSGSATPPPAEPTLGEPPLPYGPDTCKDGFVWRDAIPGDHVCVTPDRRATAANENAIAGSRVDPAGAYGPNSCMVGFVWREAYVGDVVCVTPARRTEVYQENVDGPNNRVLP